MSTFIATLRHVSYDRVLVLPSHLYKASRLFAVQFKPRRCRKTLL